jgi:hypothetical protein
VNIFDDPFDIASLAGTSAPAFAHLTTLIINAQASPSTANLLRALYLKNLKSLEILFASPSNSLSQVFTAIQASCDGLKSLVITSLRGKTKPFLSSPDIIAPLFSLRNLTSLQIDAICRYDLDDTVLKEMASAWPLLQKFHFHITRQDFQPKATLKGLAAIISGCRQLREVHTRIYVSAVQTRDINVQEYNSNGSVFDLHLTTSLVDDDVNLVELAEIFAILCPKLTYLGMKPPSVRRILRNLLTTRDEE